MTMNSNPDLYATLGVPPSATAAEISHAYRALLHRHHPDTRDTDDRAGDASSDQALQQILAAYTVLRDPARRAAYDHASETPERPTRREPQHLRDHPREHWQPPIIAGPVRWHPTL